MSLENFQSAGVSPQNPFSADLDPNATPPAAARLFEIPDRTEHGAVTRKLQFYAEYDTPSGGGITYDGTVWVKDEAQNNWIRALDFTTAAEFEGIQIDNIAPGVVFLQVTAISAGTIDNINFFAAPI